MTDIVGTAISVRTVQRPPTPEEDAAIRQQIKDISTTDFVPQAYRGKVYEMYACVLTGRSLGLDPMTSLRQIYVVDGKATLSAELMVALVRRAGHSISGSSSATEATARGRRVDNGDEFEVSFTIDEAKKIKTKERQKEITLDQKTVWQHYPADMLWARAVSRLCRRLFPDVLAGVSYTPDEAELTPEERSLGATEDLPLPPDPEEPSLSEPDRESPAPDMPAGDVRSVPGGASGSESDASLSEARGTGLSEPGSSREAPTLASESEEIEGHERQTELPLPDDVRRNLGHGYEDRG